MAEDAVIVTPGSAPPCASLIRPEIVPVGLPWSNAGRHMSTENRTVRRGTVMERVIARHRLRPRAT